MDRIDTLNLTECFWWDRERATNHNIRTLIGDACSLTMPDRSYDIAFSNSVIEHVGSWERQQQFASEIRRVGGALWVQTPAYEYPIEPHYMAPFIHWLPRKVQKRIARWCTLWGWIEQPGFEKIEAMVDTTRLLTRSEMRRLFYDCEIRVERLLWVFPKSYIAVRLKPEP